MFTLFAVFAAWRSPVPGVNEPHYLCKAKHFWDSGWCARDLFLSSANAHWTFYATVGSLTRVLSLEQVAWIGRILVSGGLGLAWVRLASLFVKNPLSLLGSACFFLALGDRQSVGRVAAGGRRGQGFCLRGSTLGDRRGLPRFVPRGGCRGRSGDQLPSGHRGLGTRIARGRFRRRLVHASNFRGTVVACHRAGTGGRE